MNIYDVINQRRTIRDFQDREVPIEIIENIIDAGLKAPTNDHMRNWEFVIITDQEEKAKVIHEIHRNTTKQGIEDFFQHYNMSDPCQKDMYRDAIPKQYSMLYQSGCLILPFFRQDTPLLKPETLSSLNAFASIWCCIENILLAATSEGLYGVMRIPSEREAIYIKEVIGHPDNYIMPTYLSIGYPAEQAVKNTQHHVDAKQKIHRNRW